MKLSGLYAAVVTPVDGNGQVDLATFDRICDFVLERGVDGICVGGATSEFPRFELAERRLLVDRATSRVRAGSTLLTAIGAPSVERVLELGACAMEAGSTALLLPMPSFFRYQQQDLAAFASHVAEALRAPCLLYDLPEFSNGLERVTATRLLSDCEHIAGIKDSSGRIENMAYFAGVRGNREWTLLVGDDRCTSAGLAAGWDGGVSGVACCCPELMVAVHRAMRAGHLDEARRCQALLDELIERLSVLPTPWGVRVGLAARGIETGPLSLPLAPERRRQVTELRSWLVAWLERADVPNTLNVQRPATL